MVVHDNNNIQGRTIYVSNNLYDPHIIQSYCAPPPPFCLGGVGGLNLQPNFQKGGGGVTGHQLLEGVELSYLELSYF